jgi:CDP-6-deoxy-D-xylo-4-hexulose-3-dehydrase
LKPTDLQAAIGVAQLQRLDDFVARRRTNFDQLYAGLKQFEDRLLLPEHLPASKPAWFGFPITVREGVSRRRLVQWLEDGNIETRELFGGHILRQPGYVNAGVRVHGELINSERIVRDTFFVGVYPGLDERMVDYMVERFASYFART